MPTVEESLVKARGLRRSARRIQLANPEAARIIRRSAKNIEVKAARRLGKQPKKKN